MCQVNIIQVTGTPVARGINVLVKGSSSDCKDVRVRFNVGSVWAPSQFVAVDAAGFWSTTFPGLPHQCGDSYEVEACCLNEDGSVNLLCCDSQGGAIQCPNDCCLEPIVNLAIGECDNQGNVAVTFTLQLTVTDASCLPYVFEVDFGDGNTSSAQLINATGTQNFTITHVYSTIPSLSYVAKLNFILPTGCPSASISVHLPPCPPVDCCPDLSVQTNVKDCNDDCKREVEVVTSFSPPPANCPYASLQWAYYDASNNLLQYGQAFNNLMSSPHVDTLYFSPADSPITAKLNTANPPLDCPELVTTIIVPDCDGCPKIDSFNYTVKNCVTKANQCCRKVEFDIKGVFCGNPKIRIDYGDGNFDERVVSTNGQSTLMFVNEYCTDGNFTASLSVVTPSVCPSQTLPVTVPKCDPADCHTTDPDPTPTQPSKFCPCCILLVLTILIYFVLWAMGLYEEQVVILGQTLNVGALAGGLFGLLIFLATLCFFLVPSCRDCVQCRIAWCTMIGALLAVIIILVLLIINIALIPQWLWAGITAFLLFLTALAMHRSARCQNFWRSGNCS